MRADNQLMKKINRETLREVLQKCQKATKPELAAKTGLSVVTINALITDLIQRQEVEENGLVPSEGGRPSMQYRYNNNFCHAAVLYCYQKEEQTYAHCLVIDLSGKVIWRQEKFYTEVEMESFTELLDQAFQTVEKIKVIAFGLPGEANEHTVLINDYEKLIGKEFFSYYKERYHVPILFENDVNAMTYGYYCSNRGKKEDIVVGVYFPKRYIPGAGIILNQKIYYGTQHFAGEMKRLPVPIPWEQLNYDDEEEVFKELKTILEIFGCTFAPAKFILYGDFFTLSLIKKLKEFTQNFFGQSFCINIEITENIEKDYETGMISLVLEKLKQKIEDLEENLNESEGKNACRASV